MFQYAVIFLLLLNATLSVSACCEQEIRTKSFLDSAMDMISKAKSTVPSCRTSEENCPEVKKNLDCADLYTSGYKKSGLYNITLFNRIMTNKTLTVYCDMESDGGGWTVIQRRGNFGSPNDYFYKDWNSYKNGFGNPEKDFWIGNDNIFALTNQNAYSIRFDLQHKNQTRAYAKYESFWIDDEYNNYTLHISGYSGNAGDSMSYHNTHKFSTKGKDNDNWTKGECALDYRGGWWYNYCYYSNLNGEYNQTETKGIRWKEGEKFKILISTEMKIRLH